MSKSNINSARPVEEATVAGQRLEDVKLDDATPERVCLEVDRVGRSYYVHHVDGTTYVDSPWSMPVRIPAIPAGRGGNPGRFACCAVAGRGG